MRKVKDIRYSGASDICKLDMYLPDKDGFDTIVYYHGGGLEGGTRKDTCYVEIAERFAQEGYGFVSVEYRMYPHGAKFPEYLEDGAAAVKYVKENIKKYGGSGGLYVGGQSAGAWITLMLCLNKEYFEKAGLDGSEILGWISDSAQTTSHFNVLKYETGGNPSLQRIDKFAPLYYVDENTAFSKLLLIFYEDDMPCRPEQNHLFEKAIKAFHKDADITKIQLHGGHCFGSTQKDPDGEYAFVKTALQWLRKN